MGILLTFDAEIPILSVILVKFAMNGSKASWIPTPNSAFVISFCDATSNFGTRIWISPKLPSAKNCQYGIHLPDIASIAPTGNFSFAINIVIWSLGSSKGNEIMEGTSSSDKQFGFCGKSEQENIWGKLIFKPIISTIFVVPSGSKKPPGWDSSNLTAHFELKNLIEINHS